MLNGDSVQVLYEEVVEVDERVIPFDESCQMGSVGDVKEVVFGKKARFCYSLSYPP